MKKFMIIATLFVAISLVTSSCEVVKDVAKTMQNISRLQFKLGGVNNVNISGITIGNRTSMSQFKFGEIATLTKNVAANKFPVSFTLIVNAKNPNDGTGGSSKSTKSTISALPWDLYINDVQTVSGNIGSNISVPGTGKAIDIPIQIKMDFFQFFKDRGYKELGELALAISGVNNHEADIKLKAQPTVSTPYGPINYPGKLTIVKKSWTN
jgi:predicted small secreted protein